MAKSRFERLMAGAAAQVTPQKYRNGYVAPIFQRMIRAEAGAEPAGRTYAIVDQWGMYVWREVGQVVCVTCGLVGPWSSGGADNISGMHTGHFLSQRRNSIIFEEDNVAPQCCGCNFHHNNDAPQTFRVWMVATRGSEVVKRLQRLKNTTVSFAIEDLVRMRIKFSDRLKAAEKIIREQS